MGPHVLLEELGVDFKLIEVSLFSPDPDDEFLTASPHARVPALRHSHGTVCESGAIALYLSDTHPEKGFGIVAGHPDRARFLQWLFYLSSTLQPEVLIQFHPESYFDNPELQTKLKAASMARLDTIWDTLNSAYEVGLYLFGNHPTAVDICLAIQIQWPECFSDGISQYPNLARMLEHISTRDAYVRAMQWHQNGIN
jgi:glutathione S-transferase